VPKLSLKQYSKEQLKELSLIEMAYEFLKNSKQAISFHELLTEVTKAAELSEDEVRTRIAQFYTDINIDGRFLSLGDNRWGLRVWYPVDTQEEEVVTVIKPKKKKAKKAVDEDELELEDFDEIDDEDYDDLDDFADEDDDLLDEDEDILEDLDAVDEFDDDDEDEIDEEIIEDDDEFALDDDEDDEEDEDLAVEEDEEL
jgi:DNA-directed RNA polymerase subunit delta